MVKASLSATAPHRAERPPATASTPMSTLAVVVVVVAALYFGREIFVPLALAVLLSFALGPLVTWLRRHRVGRVPAVGLVVLLAFIAIFGIGAVVATQVAGLADNLPRYQFNIEAKIHSVRESHVGGGVIERASEMLKDLNKEIAKPAPAPPEAGRLASPAEPREGVEPIPVEIQAPEPTPLELVQQVIGPLVKPVSVGGIVLVFVIFMLLQREDLRDRLIRLAGAHDLQRTTEALDDAAQRVGHYLLMQLVVNATYGLPVGIGLWVIGVPNPALWGILAMLLRFIPYIGPVIAAAFPLALSVAVDPGWSMLLWTGALFIGLELVSNNLIEPWLYGSSTGLSPVAIIVAAIFWTWLWGPIGLLLSTPLTVCLVVLGRHAPHLTFLDVLLGSEPVLTPAEGLYQRLLAGDPDEATERAEELLEEQPLAAFYDEVAIPALALAERDRARGALDDERRALVFESAVALVDNLSEHEEEEDAAAPAPDDAQAAAPSGTAKDAAEPPPGWRHRAVLCAAGRGNLDEAAAAMLGQLLERHGVGARIVRCELVTSANLPQLDLDGVRMVCLSYMNATSTTHARYLVRRLRRKLPDVPILVGFWGFEPDEEARNDPLAATGADLFATSLAQAAEQVLEVSRRAGESPNPAPRRRLNRGS